MQYLNIDNKDKELEELYEGASLSRAGPHRLQPTYP